MRGGEPPPRTGSRGRTGRQGPPPPRTPRRDKRGGSLEVGPEPRTGRRAGTGETSGPRSTRTSRQGRGTGCGPPSRGRCPRSADKRDPAVFASDSEGAPENVRDGPDRVHIRAPDRTTFAWLILRWVP